MTRFYLFQDNEERAAIDELINYLTVNREYLEGREIAMSVNAIDGTVYAPSKKNKCFRIPLAFSPDQFKEAPNTIKPLVESTILCIAFKQKPKVESEAKELEHAISSEEITVG